MFAKTTIMAVLALADVDPSASDAEKRKLRELVSGDIDERALNGVLTFTEAAARLGAKNPQFARRLAKRGRLMSVYGTASRPMGVTAESVNAYIERGGAVEDNHFIISESKHTQAKTRLMSR